MCVLEQVRPHTLGQHLAGGRPWDLDRTYGGLRVLFPHQGDGESGWHQGNADAIYRNRSVLRDVDPDVVLVLSADHVYKLDYRKVVDAHLERQAELTMVTTVVTEDEARRFGNVSVDDDGRIEQFVYKPDNPIGDVVTTEVFAFETGALLDAMDELAGSRDGNDEGGAMEDFGDDLLPYLVDAGRVFDYRFDGYWRDVGTLESYWEAHMDLLEARPRLRLDDRSWPVLTTDSSRPPARLYRSASIDSSLVSPACTVRGRVTRSVLGPGVVVEEGAEVSGSVLLHDTVVEAGGRISGAVCDMGVRVAGGASVGRQIEAEDLTSGDLVVLGEGVQVPAGAEVSAGSRVEAGGPV